MAKLVAFYSRADENYFAGQYRYIEVGNTEKVAKTIAEVADAEIFRIEQKVPYAADYNTCIKQAQTDLRKNVRPELINLPANLLNQYDEIYLGYPNYWGDMPMAVYTFLEAYHWNGKVIYPFCTHEGSGLSGTEHKIAEVCKGAKVKKGLAIRGSDTDHSKTAILSWLKK